MPVTLSINFGLGVFAMLYDHHHAGIEVLLRLINSRQAKTFRGNHVLNCNFGAVGFEDGVTIGIVAYRHQVAKNKEVGHFRRRDHPHQVEVEV